MKTNVIHTLCSNFKRENFFRLCLICVGLLISVCASADLVTISYTSNGTTYYLAVSGTNVTRVDGTPTEACLWERQSYGTAGQYTLRSITAQSYLEISTRRELRLASAGTLLTFANDNNTTIYGRPNGDDTYYIRYNNGWSVTTRSNNATTLTIQTWEAASADEVVDLEFTVSPTSFTWDTYEQPITDTKTATATVVGYSAAYKQVGGTATIGKTEATLDPTLIVWTLEHSGAPTQYCTGTTTTNGATCTMTFAPNEINHKNVTSHAAFVDNWAIRCSYNGTVADPELVQLTTTRSTYYEELISEIEVEFTETASAFPRVPSADNERTSQTFTLNGVITVGTAIRKYDGTLISSTATPQSLKDFTNIRYEVRPATTTTPTPAWLTATGNGTDKVTVTAIAENPNETPRTALLVVMYEDEQGVLHDLYTLDLMQAGSVFSGLLLRAQEGYSGRSLDAKGQQTVHEAYSTIYYADGDTLTLVVRERSFNAWQRWYNYENQADLGDAYVTNPGGTVIESVQENGSTLSQGRYAMGVEVYQPKVRYTGLEATKEHWIACDVSNYQDTAWLEHILVEPTLSTRQIFHLVPAAQRAAELEAATGEVYLEEYTIHAPTSQQICLYAEYLYDWTSVVSTRRGVADFGYVYQDGETYKHIGHPNALQAKWYTDGVEGGVTPTGGSLGDVNNVPTGKKTVVYTLRADKYNLCKFTVHYDLPSVIGPAASLITAEEIAKDYKVLGALHFDFDGGPKTTDFAAWNEPLSWPESSYGYTYPGHRSYRSRQDGGDMYAYWGEYMFVNKPDSGTGSWLNIGIVQHGNGIPDARTGYMMYVDGTQTQGLVASLDAKAELCEGQQMYCSAWIANPASGNTLPILRFAILGNNDGDDEWHPISEYTTGKFEKTETEWQQVFFEIDLSEKYDNYRVAIYDFATSASGNDFVIDDIVLFASQVPLMAYQASTVCDDENVQAVLRLDYESITDNNLRGSPVYYDVFDSTHHAALDLYYVGTTVINGTDTIPSRYGKINVPALNFTPTTDEIYPNLKRLIEAVSEDPLKSMGYILENVDGQQRYVLYIVHLAPLAGDTKYYVRMANVPEELPNASCSMTSELPVSKAYDVVLNHQVISNELNSICGNISYNISLNLNQITTDEEGVHNLVGKCLSDWLFEATEEDGLTFEYEGNTYPVSYDSLYNVIVESLRREEIGVSGGTTIENPNLRAATLEEIDPQYLRYPDSDYALIELLVESGYLVLAQEDIDVYIPAGHPMNYMVLPILGTGYAFDEEGNKADIAMCFKATEIGFISEYDANLVLELGKYPSSELPEVLQTRPTVVRTSLANVNAAVELPIVDIQNVVINGDVTMTSTTDPEYDLATDYFAFTPDRQFNVLEPDKYYQPNENIILEKSTKDAPSGKAWKDLREGYSYTFEIKLADYNGVTGNWDPDNPGECPTGSRLITLNIVPEYLIWMVRRGNDSWNNDANWHRTDATGKEILGPGFVPMDHSNVIIAKGTTIYPVLEDPTTYMANHMINLNANDLNYQAADCKQIYMQPTTKLKNQQYLKYEKAFVDMQLLAGNWYIMTPPLQHVWLGDIYTPSVASLDADPFAPGDFDGKGEGGGSNRGWPYAYYHSFFNETTTLLHENETKNKEIFATEWSYYVNEMENKYDVGNGYALMGYGPTNASGEELTVRLPKNPDQRYEYYYDWTGNYQPSGRYADGIERPTDGSNYKFAYELKDNKMEITLRNESADTKYFVFGNPSMAYLNMSLFLAGNSEVVNSTFYTLGETSNFKPYNDFVKPNYLLEPMRGVMLEAKGDGLEIAVTITPEMLSVAQVDGTVLTPGLTEKEKPSLVTTSAKTSILSILAENWGYQSKMYLGESTLAHDKYVESEDSYVLTTQPTAAAMADGAFTPFSPISLYAINNDKVLSIDMRKYITTVPLGLSVMEGINPYTDLWFSGVEQFDDPIYFVDSVAGTSWRILNGLCLRVENPQPGEERYYIHYRDRAPEITTETDDEIAPSDEELGVSDLRVSYFNSDKNEVMVSSNAIMRYIAIYDVMGRLVGEARPNNLTSTITLPTGAYIFRVETAKSSTLDKVLVK